MTKRTAICLATAALALTGCAQTKGKAIPGDQANRMVVEGSFTPAYAACSRGILRATVLRDWLRGDGEAYVKGKGFMTKAPLPEKILPIDLLGDTTKLRGPKAPDTSKLEYQDLGNQLLLFLGTAPVQRDPENAPAEGKAATYVQMLREAYKLVMNADDPDSPFEVALQKNAEGIYSGTKPVTTRRLLESEGEAQTAAAGIGVGQIRSLVLHSQKLSKMFNNAIPMNLPGAIDGEGGVKVEAGKAGEPIKIQIQPGNPAAGKAWLTVEVRDPADMFKWSALYRVEDAGQKEIEVKTAWQDAKGKKSAMPHGKNWVLVSRSQMSALPVGEGGGNFCMETMSAAIVGSGLKDPNKK